MSKWPSIVKHPCGVLITGKRGSGKSALGYYLLEELSQVSCVQANVVGLPRQKWYLLPDSIKPVYDLNEIPEGSISLFDEASLRFYARSFNTSENKLMDWLLSISRQKDQTVIFISHHTRKLDLNLVTDVDILCVKQPGLFHSKLERPEIKKLTRTAAQALAGIAGDKRPWSYVFSDDFEGMLENPLPSFWSEELSRAYAGISLIPEAITAEQEMSVLFPQSEWKLINTYEFSKRTSYIFENQLTGVKRAHDILKEG